MFATWLDQHSTALIGGLGVALLTAFALIAALFVRLEQTRDDLERVEGGALLSTVQLQAFRDELVTLGPSVSAGLDEAIVGLDSFGSSTLEFEVHIDEVLPVAAELKIDREVVIPIDTTIPIAQTIETTIEVRGPLGIAVPVDVAVPIELEVPVVLDLTFTVNETLPVSAEVPVRLDVPIEIAIADTDLAALGESLAAGLASFREVFAGFAE